MGGVSYLRFVTLHGTCAAASDEILRAINMSQDRGLQPDHRTYSREHVMSEYSAMLCERSDFISVFVAFPHAQANEIFPPSACVKR